ncbi:DEAD/DEAH box helicase [Desulfobacterota bacterium M19]
MQQFKLLKRHPELPAKLKNIHFTVQLDFDDTGAYLQTVDARGRELAIPPLQAAGRQRDLLRALAVIRERQGFQIDWQNEGNRVYVKEHDYLVEMAARTGLLRLTEGGEITLDECPGRLELQLSSMEPPLRWHLCLIHPRSKAEGPDIRLLSERYLLVENSIYEIEAIGENFNALPLFHTSIAPADLNNFLSLICSSFSDIKLRYLDYGLRAGQPVIGRAAIIFEQVDIHEGLQMSVSALVDGYSPQFFHDYDISRIVDLNEIEKNLVIREIIEPDTAAAISEIHRLLVRHKKKAAGPLNDFYQDGPLFVIEKDLAAAFLYRELTRLLSKYILLGTENLRSYRIKPVKQPHLSLRLNHGLDFLEGDGSLIVEKEEFNLLDLLKKYRKNGYLTLSNGQNIILEKKYIDRLQRLFDHKDGKLRASFFDLPLIEELLDNKAAASLPGSRQIFLGFNDIAASRPRIPKINGTLRSYQKYGYKWLRYLHKHGLGGCLADDMGLGKTLQTIALLASVNSDSKKPSLIIMPRSLLVNWAREIAAFYPQLSVYTWYGASRELEKAASFDVILTTYGMVRSNIETFKEQPFHYVILDESQNIKNSRSQASRAVALLNAEHRLALSGTPIENNIGELYSLFRFLNPAMFRTEDEFMTRYGRPIQQDNDPDAIHELRQKVYPFILRRMKKDVLTDLPDKVEQLLYVDMSAQQERLYEERRIFYKEAIDSQIASQGLNKSQFFILQALLELRQIASCPESRSDGAIISPKRELLREQLMETVANGRKALVFGNFLSVIESVCQDLEEAGIPYRAMTGATRKRQELVDQFQNNSDIKVLVMTLKTGGIGLNLTAADTIFIFDPWWNMAAENQAVDRSHRIGQEHTVFCYKLLCRHTIEEKMVELQEKKRELMDAIVANDSGAVKKLTASDVEFILS